VNRFWKAVSLGSGLLLLAGILLNLGCSSSGKTRFRFMNAMPDQNSLDVLVNPTTNTKPTFTNVAYGTATSYQAAPSGSQTVEIEPTGVSTALFNQSISFNSGADTTVMAANFTASVTVLTFSDNNSIPATNDFNLRVINVAPSLGTTGPGVDVYVEIPGTDINTVNPPTISALGFGKASNYLALAGGNWEITVTANGSKFPAFPSTGSLSFTAGQVRTFVILNSQGGGETYSTLSDLN
jgi:hypothetical protein